MSVYRDTVMPSSLDPASPLVPHREDTKNTGIMFTFGITVLFVAITSVVVFAKGQGHFLRGFLVLGVALLLLFLSTSFLLWHIRSSDAEPRLRYLATFQSLCLVFLCICILVVLYEPQPPCDCPTCAPSCDLSVASNLCIIPQGLSQACFGSSSFRPPLYTGVNTNTQSCPCAFQSQPPFNCSLTG